MNYNNQTLYKLDSKNKVRIWNATTDFLTTDAGITISISHGLEGGKIVTKERHITAGKNIGKSNETTIEQQTQSELNSLYQSQIDKGYVLNIDEFKVRERPMLAHTYEAKKHTVKYGNAHYASEKLNGVRCFVKVTKSGISFESRTEKAFKDFNHFHNDINTLVDQIRTTSDIISLSDSIYIDAEIFHPTMPFEVICSLVNSKQTTGLECEDEYGKIWTVEDLELHVYDFVFPSYMGLIYSERFIPFKHLFNNLTTLKHVEQHLITTEDDFITLSKTWILKGCEGGMLRADAVYEFNTRSIYLLKFKVMVSEEFLITDIFLAENDNTKVMFVLNNPHNDEIKYNTFKCGIEGSKELTLTLYKERKKHIQNSMLTVEYQTLSAYGVPLFPVGIGIREGEVIDGIFYPST